MTVTDTNLVTEYTGTGERTFFEFGFDVAYDTNVYVLVDGAEVSYQLQETGIVITPAPALGAEIVIYRATDVNQLRDFKPFELFSAAKTENAVDKLILIKQEALAYRMQLNLRAEHYIDKVVLNNSQGSNPEIFIWKKDESGVFAGLVTRSMPEAGAIVDRPEGYAYFQYGDEIVVFSKILTTTLYPIQATDAMNLSASIVEGYMWEAPNEFFRSVSPLPNNGVLRSILVNFDAGDEFFRSVSPLPNNGTLVSILVTLNAGDEFFRSVNPDLTDATLEDKLVRVTTQTDGLAMDAALVPELCELTDVV